MPNRTHFRGLAALAALLVAVAAAPAAQGKQVPSTWSWTDYGPALRAVSCITPDQCVAVGQRGIALRTSTDDDVPLAWSGDLFAYPEELADVACTVTSCLAVSTSRIASATYVSKVYRSTDGGKTWTMSASLPSAGATKTRTALAIACDTASEAKRACYAAGPGGGIWRSRTDGRTWNALTLPKIPAAYNRLACPAAGSCAAVGGEYSGSSAVIAGTKVTQVDVPKKQGAGMLGLACDTKIRCVATDGLGQYMLLSIRLKSWAQPKLLPKAMKVTDIACPVKNVCVGLAGAIALRTTELSSTTGSWKRRPLGTLKLDAITCKETNCVAVGKAGSWFASFDAGYSFRRVNEVGGFSAIDCQSAFQPTCVAGGDKDFGVSQTRGTLWRLPFSGYSGLDTKSLFCSGPAECLVLGKEQTLATTDLELFDSRFAAINDPKGADGLQCVTKDLCVGLNEGVVYTTLDGARTPWSRSGFPARATSLACLTGRTEPVTCLATTRDFIILGTMSRAGGTVRWNWFYTDADPSSALEAIACSPGGQCTAVGDEGVILTTVGTDRTRWQELTLDATEPVALRPTLKSVSCPADGVCLAGGVHPPNAIIASTRNNWADYASDEFQGIEGAAPTIMGFGCESVSRCVAVGSTALVGVQNTRRRAVFSAR